MNFDFDRHIQEVMRLRREADVLDDDAPGALIQKIKLLSHCLVWVGRLSSHLDGEYKRLYAHRKRVHAQAYIDAKTSKQAHAELAVVDIRMAEAQAYEDMRRWRNAHESMIEEIHALKLKMRVDFADGNVGENVV